MIICMIFILGRYCNDSCNLSDSLPENWLIRYNQGFTFFLLEYDEDSR
jgi:hypothetical protein